MPNCCRRTPCNLPLDYRHAEKFACIRKNTAGISTQDKTKYGAVLYQETSYPGST